MELYKRYIKVVAEIDQFGQAKPLGLYWDDGCYYPIDRIMKHQASVRAQVGGCGELFVCRIQGNIRHLFYEKYQDSKRWFLESTKP